MECPAGPHCGWLFPALFLWWAPCPESFYSSPWLSLPLFSDFGIPQCLFCAAHLPWPWLWWRAQTHHQALCGFSALSSLSQNPFFPPFPVFLSLCCSLQCLSYHFIRVASVIARFKTCEGLFTAVRSFSADTEEELTPPFFGLPVSSQPRRLRTTAALWALGSSDPPRLLF